MTLASVWAGHGTHGWKGLDPDRQAELFYFRAAARRAEVRAVVDEVLLYAEESGLVEALIGAVQDKGTMPLPQRRKVPGKASPASPTPAASRPRLTPEQLLEG